MAKAPLLEWIAANHPHVRVDEHLVDVVAPTLAPGTSSDAAADRSIVARDAIPAAQVLVTLASGAFLDSNSWLHDIETRQSNGPGTEAVGVSATEVRDELQRLQLSPTLRLVLALLHERTHSQQSRFNGYIAQLPTHISLPMNWSVRERRLLKHTAAAPSVDDELVVSLFERFVAPLAHTFPTLWSADELTLATFQWAYAVVSSRAFTVDSATEPALLPVIDMANHAAANPAAKIVRAADGSFQLVTVRAVAKDEAVTISYGDLSNAQLLCRYGFVLSESVPSDCMLVTSSELLATYTAFLNDDVANLASPPSEDDSEGEQEQPVHGREDQVRPEQREPPAKKRRVFAEKKHEDDADSLFFQLTGNQEQEFGLGDALLSFVFARNLPADALYDVLSVLLRRRDKVYSAVLERHEKEPEPPVFSENQPQSESETAIAAANETALALLLTKHERAVCRRILIGLMALQENSSDEDEDEDEDEDGDEDAEDDDGEDEEEDE